MKRRRFFPIGIGPSALVGWIVCWPLTKLTYVSIFGFSGVIHQASLNFESLPTFFFKVALPSVPPAVFWIAVSFAVLKAFDRKEEGAGKAKVQSYGLAFALVATSFGGFFSLLVVGSDFIAAGVAIAYAIAGIASGIVAFLMRRRHDRKQQAKVANVFAP